MDEHHNDGGVGCDGHSLQLSIANFLLGRSKMTLPAMDWLQADSDHRGAGWGGQVVLLGGDRAT